MGLTDALSLAWSTQGKPAVDLRCAECRHRFGWITDTDAGPLVVAHSEFRRRNEPERERLRRLKERVGYRASQSVESRLLESWTPLWIRCRCKRGIFEIDERQLLDAWNAKRGTLSL